MSLVAVLQISPTSPYTPSSKYISEEPVPLNEWIHIYLLHEVLSSVNIQRKSKVNKEEKTQKGKNNEKDAQLSGKL